MAATTDSLQVRRLNLGCGDDYREGWHNVDVADGVDVDQHVDLEETPWPFMDQQFVRVDARHVLEHLETVPWDELYRVIEPDGILRITYPIGHTRDEDVTHEQRWNWNTASFLGGETVHGHEISGSWELVDRSFDWGLSQPDPLTHWYVRWRLWYSGPGVWLDGVPGLYGEWTADLRREP